MFCGKGTNKLSIIKCQISIKESQCDFNEGDCINNTDIFPRVSLINSRNNTVVYTDFLFLLSYGLIHQFHPNLCASLLHFVVPPLVCHGPLSNIPASFYPFPMTARFWHPLWFQINYSLSITTRQCVPARFQSPDPHTRLGSSFIHQPRRSNHKGTLTVSFSRLLV